jgi:arylsulfatase A-like enzyme
MVDVAPTILDLAGVRAPATTDGASFAGTIETGAVTRGATDAVFLEWAGDERIPAWIAVRTSDFKLIRYADGFEELYDLSGRRWPADPWETTNRATDPRAVALLRHLRALLGRVLGPG